MSAILKQPVTGHAAWHGCDIARDESWLHRLSVTELATIDAALHSRTEFEDHDHPAQRLKLLRLWLKMPKSRVLAPEFPEAKWLSGACGKWISIALKQEVQRGRDVSLLIPERRHR